MGAVEEGRRGPQELFTETVETYSLQSPQETTEPDDAIFIEVEEGHWSPGGSSATIVNPAV